MADTTPKAVEDCHELLRWLIPHLDKFPRSRRFTLGERIESGLLEVLEALVSAAYSRDKRADLELANRRVNVVCHLWRLAFELKAIAPRTYEHGAGRIVGLGAQIGGWRKTALP
jgi:hypothetical protein